MKPGDAASLARYVVKRAPQYQLDPAAVIAVAAQEGISGQVGDNGTSFGPWQLHQGGAYPASAPQTSQAANAWAWSPAGVDYALGRMSSVAGGLKGKAAVRAIVYSFERPANPSAEYQSAVQALPQSDGGPGGGSASGVLGDILGGVYQASPVGTAVTAAGAVTGAASSAEGIASFLGKLTNPATIIRVLEIVGGGVIALLGLYLLARSQGLAPSGHQVARTALGATPAGRAALAESKVAGAVAGGG